MNNLIGQTINRYHIIEQLGEGGMATVYKAFDTRLERQVAIKLIRREAFSREIFSQVLARFEREAKALAQLSHPNIVKVYDYGEYKGSPYLVMEFVPGGTLKQHTGKAIPWSEAVRLLLPVAKALQYAHDEKIIHRDIKPGNILITSRGEPMLSDFGIAKILENTTATTLTGTGVGIGTPEYMAPEQGMGSEVNGRSDLYALGVVLYELITGRRPFIADTPLAVLMKHMTDPLPRPREFIPDLPDSVEQVLFKALAKNPQDRYPDMGAFVQALERLITEEVLTKKIEKKKQGYLRIGIFIGLLLFVGLIILAGFATYQIFKRLLVIYVTQTKSVPLESSTQLAIEKNTENPSVSGEMMATPSALKPIIFESTRGETATDIWSIDPKQAGKLVQLTNMSVEELFPVWSPDFLKIAFTYFDHSTNMMSIWVMNADGSNAHPISEGWERGGGSFYTQAWSPDGQKLYFEKDHGGGPCYFSWIEANGQPGQVEHPVLGAENQCQISISPDGKSIVLRTYGNRVDLDIGDLSPDGTKVSNVRTLVSATSILGEMVSPDWSPDGSKILFTADGKVYSVAANGMEEPIKLVIPGELFVGMARWSPDGRSISLMFSSVGSYDISVVSLDGTNWQNLTSDNFNDGVLDW